MEFASGDTKDSTPSGSGPDVPLAIVVDGASDKWQSNVLEILGRLALVAVTVEAHGTIDVPTIILRQDQARHLATQIIEILGPENNNRVRRSS